jgi:gliding motility-associated-like protein
MLPIPYDQMTRRIFVILFILISFSHTGAWASHIVGGDFSYVYLGDTVISGVLKQKYRVTLFIYQDCVTGVPDAIQQDNPAFFTVYNNDDAPFTDLSLPFDVDTNIYYNPSPTSGGAIQVPANFSNECIDKLPELCLLRKKFENTYYFPHSNKGYTVIYQRCCRNSSIINIIAPGDEGATYYCTIPPTAIRNNSAVFKNYPPQIICLNNPLYYDHSASDPDGDSLTYEFCPAEVGADGADIKPIVSNPPPYDTVSYFTPFTFQNPISGFPVIQIDPESGIVSGTPNRIGRYLVTVCCHEWRNGVMINTTKREFQFVVTDCSKKVIADIPIFSTSPNTYIVNCVDYRVHFVNTSKGGFDYRWSFDLEGNPAATSTEFEPTLVYPDTGTYLVKLVVNPASTCPDSITRFVKIYPVFKADFTDSGNYCPGAAILFTDKTMATIKPIQYWKWNFGDGITSTEQNPTHAFARGGTYNVLLTSENVKNCVDTALKRIVVQDFRPYAGDDTIIVKGEYIQFDARGGTKYSWIRGYELSDTSISNPRAKYNDTGTYTYTVFVRSDFGCTGLDTITVWVVDRASFTVPNAFSPNGDGHNDVFRPHAVGYKKLKYFKVFNRWGQEVYTGNSLETGWDGTWAGRPGEIGVYFWQISYIDRFGKDGFLKGDVTLIR